MKTHAEKIKEIIQSEFAHSISYSNMSNVINFTNDKDNLLQTITLLHQAFNFVDKIYPSANVKQAHIYVVSPFLLSNYGYNGVGGFYDINSKVVIISSYIINPDHMHFGINGNYTLDEVLCHELIHYASMAVAPVSSRYLEEEIAYGKSAIYLAEKGRDAEWIIKNNQMPYLVNIVNKDDVKKLFLRKLNPTNMKICEKTVEKLINDNHGIWMNILLEEAYKIGMSIIKKYLPNDFIKGDCVKIDNVKLNIDDEL